MCRRILLATAVLFAAEALSPLLDVAVACPNCKAANATESNRPRAYMYSILFMLSVPATLVTSFGIGFYRLSKKQAELLAEAEGAAGDSPLEP